MTAGSPRWPIAARPGPPSETAVRTKTSSEIPNSTGSSTTRRRATSASISGGARPPARLSVQPDLAHRPHVHLRRARHRRALQPLDRGLLQQPARVPVDEDPRGLLDDQLLGLPV